MDEKNEKIRKIKKETLILLILNDREKLKQHFLVKNRNYSKIGIDSNITIGIEIETEGIMSAEIKKIKKFLTRNEKNCTWSVKNDVTLDNGAEVVSPIMTDNLDDIDDIYIVCEILKRCKQEVNEDCAGHIHLGANYLTSKESYANLFEIFGNTERILYLISNKENQIPRLDVVNYADSISHKFSKAIKKGSINLEDEEDLNQFVEGLQRVQESKFSSINLLNIYNEKNTIEFRMPNGTLDPDVWIENIRLFGRIIEISERLAKIEQKDTTVEEKRLIELREKLKEEMPEQEKMEILLKLLFLEEERDIYRRRYLENSKLIENLKEKENPLYEIELSKVDFKRKHGLGEFQSIAQSERNSSISNINNELAKDKEKLQEKEK